jgi:NDP-sugar pyrophosphorylase family protein
VGLGAIVVMGAEQETFCSSAAPVIAEDPLLAQPMACVEILGRSMIERTVERLVRAEVEVVSVLVAESISHLVQPFSATLGNVQVQVVTDAASAVTDKLRDYAERGIEHSFIISASLYAETDLLDLFYFHREARQAATRALNNDGSLDLWVVNCLEAEQSNLADLLLHAHAKGASYFVREYVNRLTHPRDLRLLASDVLRGRCAIRPSGQEIKPGIWVDEGAEIHRRARIVAPAYIGRGSKVKEDTLITRCSNIEKGCHVDAGTVVEDSSILANTHIGIWLDVCHSVANGNKLLSLGRDVVIEISDPSVMRFNGSARKEARNSLALIHGNEKQKIAADPRNETPAPEAWQLGANPIQG